MRWTEKDMYNEGARRRGEDVIDKIAYHFSNWFVQSLKELVYTTPEAPNWIKSNRAIEVRLSEAGIPNALSELSALYDKAIKEYDPVKRRPTINTLLTRHIKEWLCDVGKPNDIISNQEISYLEYYLKLSNNAYAVYKECIRQQTGINYKEDRASFYAGELDAAFRAANPENDPEVVCSIEAFIDQFSHWGFAEKADSIYKYQAAKWLESHKATLDGFLASGLFDGSGLSIKSPELRSFMIAVVADALRYGREKRSSLITELLGNYKEDDRLVQSREMGEQKLNQSIAFLSGFASFEILLQIEDNLRKSVLHDLSKHYIHEAKANLSEPQGQRLR